MLQIFWVIVLFPLIGAAVNGLLGKKLPRPVVSLVACSSVLASFLVGFFSFLEMLRLPVEDRSITVTLFTWIQSGDFVSRFSLLLDPLSMVMILIVTGVGFLIHVYSVGYMRGESGYYRYFSYLNLFIFMMSTLVLADNYLLMFVGWEGVGLCSYLLIGYYFEKKSAGDAAKKAFIFNRVGDMAFLIGMFLIFNTFGTLEYGRVFEQVSERFTQPEAAFGILSAITLLLFIGATGKSAQIPLYVWLPDAMEGPTPVSALIHAATMVTAGVYMIARSAALYSRTPETGLIVALIGTVTALLAAVIAIAQRDIKRVLAYSTISQLGYMFMAVGVGAFTAGIFHLMTHAFFKALLFLGSGSVIMAMHHEQDMFRMGGLKKYLPVTWATMWVATLAISGVPLFSGFFSKDEILWQAFHTGHSALWLIGALVALLTAFYMSRLMFLTFHGRERFRNSSGRTEDHHQEPEAHHGNPREPGLVVTGPLSALAVFSVIAGYIGLPAYLGTNRFEAFLEPSFRFQLPASVFQAAMESHGLEIALSVVAIILAFSGIAVGFRAYMSDPGLPRRLAQRFSGFYELVYNKFYVDEVYDGLIVRPVAVVSRTILWKFIDVGVIDGLVNGTASMFGTWSTAVRRIQSGFVRSYAAWIFGGAVIIFLVYYLTM